MPESITHSKTGTKEQIRERVDEPPLYKVLLLNDNYTTFDFVVGVLTDIFGKAVPEAIRITNDIHQKGSGICGIYPLDIAQTKVHLVAQTSKKAGFPLQCTLEEA